MKIKIFKTFQGSGRSKIGDKPFETLLTLEGGDFIEDNEKYEFTSPQGHPLIFWKESIKSETQEILLLSSTWNETFVNCNLLFEKNKLDNPLIITGYRDVWDGEPFHILIKTTNEPNT